MRNIEIVDYDPSWPDEFTYWGGRIRRAAGDAVLRVDHIGSTSVPGLGAKDIIDIQVTVTDLDDDGWRLPIAADGFNYREKDAVGMDLLTGTEHSEQLEKRYFREPDESRRVHVHVRVEGRLNQRYALLFRDYLRANDPVRQGYEIIKRRLAELFPHDADGYYSIKDPYMDSVYEGAKHWAELTNWRPSDDHL